MSTSREASPKHGNAGRDKGAEMRDILSLFCGELELDPPWMTEVLVKENITTPRKWSIMKYSDLCEIMYMNKGVNESITADLLKGRDWLKKWKQDNPTIKWNSMRLKDWEKELEDDEMEERVSIKLEDEDEVEGDMKFSEKDSYSNLIVKLN